MSDPQCGTPTAETLTVPLEMIHGPGNFALRLSVDAPEWQMMQGDYLVCRPLAPGADPPCCSHVIVRMDGAEHLRVWHRTSFAGVQNKVRLTRGDGTTTFHDEGAVHVVGVLAGVIRKY